MTADQNSRISRRAEALLQSLGAGRQPANDILADHAEDYERRTACDGVDVAGRWYRREALRTEPRSPPG